MNPSRPLVEYHKTAHSRLSFFYGLVALLFVFLSSGLIWRQLVSFDEYTRQEHFQNQRRIVQPAPRGEIYDRNGRLLAGNRPRFSAVIYLSELRGEFRKEYLSMVRDLRRRHEERGENVPLYIDRELVQRTARVAVLQRYLNRINAITGRRETVDAEELERHFAQRRLLPFPLMQDLSTREYARIAEVLPVESPVQIYTDSARYYPFGSSAAHTLGYVVSTFDVSEEGVPGEDLRTFAFRGKAGRGGLERKFDDQLRGTSGGEVWLVDPVGFQYQLVEQKTPVKGKPLVTSLDIELQRTAERAMDGKIGAVVAIEVQTGEVLVLCSKPDYNLNDLAPYITPATYRNITDRGAWLNRAIQGLYPPGSTFKLLTTVAGLRSGKINDRSGVECVGFLRVGNRNFPCHKKSGHGAVDLERAIEQSCNVFYYEYGQALGPDRLAAEARRFGFEEPTGIELPFETQGMNVPDPAWKKRARDETWSAGDTANTSIGQGALLTTPLQLACFAASLARGETRTRPTLFHDATRNTQSIDHGGEPIGLTPAQYEKIMKGMERVILAGTGKLAGVKGVRVAGKTGTAQVMSKGRELTLAWFLGFAPIENPQIAVVVLVEGEDPDDNYHGGTTAAPIANAVFRQYFGVTATPEDLKPGTRPTRSGPRF